MIQLAAPPASKPPVIGLAAAGTSAEQPATAGFANLLADHQGASDTAAPTGGAPLARQELAASLPPAGKLLPVAAATGAGNNANMAASGESDLEASASADATRFTVPEGLKMAPGLLAALRAMRLPAPALNAPGIARRIAALGSDEGAAQAVDLSAGPAMPDPLATTTAAATTANAPAAPPQFAMADGSTAAGQLPPLIDAQLHGRPLTLAAALPGTDQAASAPPKSSAPADDFRLLPLPAARTDPPPAAAFSLANPETGTTAPPSPAAMRLRPGLSLRQEDAREGKVGALDALALTNQAATVAPAPDGSANPAAAAPVTNAAAPAAPGHDFATLVDRLIAARDASQATGTAQGVHVAVNHAEFGQVSLHFQHDGAGLTVSVDSADPDFARAVQAAVPPPGAPTAGDNAAGGNASSAGQQAAQHPVARQDSSATSGSGAGQSGSQPQARADTRAASRGGAGTGPEHSPSGEHAPRRRGVFA